MVGREEELIAEGGQALWKLPPGELQDHSSALSGAIGHPELPGFAEVVVPRPEEDAVAEGDKAYQRVKTTKIPESNAAIARRRRRARR